MGTPRDRIDRLTRRWRERHDARLAEGGDRPRANPGREALARLHFPYREMSPADYAAQHGVSMVGFAYDEESYADADLDAWLLEVGRILREGRTGKKADAADEADEAEQADKADG